MSSGSPALRRTRYKHRHLSPLWPSNRLEPMLLWAALLVPHLGVTLNLRLGSVASYESELAKLVDKPLNISAELRNEMVCVKLTDREPPEIRKLIGEALDAKWTEREHEWILEPDRVAELKSRRTAAALLKKGMDRSQAALEKVKKEGSADAEALHSLAVLKMARVLGPESIEGVQPGSVKVFAPQPSVYQYPLGAEALAIAADSMKEMKTDPRAKALHIPGPEDASKVLLGIERFPGGLGFATGMICTAEGLVVNSMSTTPVMIDEWPDWPVGKDSEVPVTLSPETKAGLERLKKTATDPSSKLLESLWMAADVVTAAAGLRDQDYVACLPDSACRLMQYGGVTTVGQGVDDLGKVTVAVVEDGVLLVTPLELESTRNGRVDRKLAAQFLAELAQKKRVTLADVSTYAFQQSRYAGATSFEQLALTASGWDPYRWDLLRPFAAGARNGRTLDRFWGSLSHRQRERLLSGETIGASQLNSTQMAELRFAATGTALISCFVTTEGRRQPAVSTIALALAPESTWRLTANTSSRSAGFVLDQGRSPVGVPASLLGYRSYQQEHGHSIGGLEEIQVGRTAFVPGSIETITVTLRAGDSVDAPMVYTDWHYDPEAKPLRVDSLPADFLKEFKSGYESGRSGAPGRSDQPPPS